MYEDRTPEQIKAEIAGDLRSEEARRRGGAWDTREGSFADDQAGPMAARLADVYASLNEVPSIIWVTENSGPYIDMAAEDLGIDPRKPGRQSVARLWVTGRPGYRIPAGKVFLTEDGLGFAVTADAQIPESGSVSVEARAQQAGTAYNVPPDSITLQFDNAAEIDAVSNPDAAAGGAGRETDAALFARVDLARKKPRTSGNKHDYEEWALETDGVGAVRVFPLYYGRGSVMVLIADESNRPVDRAVIDRCAAHIEEFMPIGGVEVTVKTPAEMPVNVSARVIPDGSAALESIQQQFQSALKEYLAQIALVKSEVVFTKVGALLHVIPGVADYTGLTVNGQEGNIVLTDEQVPVLGEVRLV